MMPILACKKTSLGQQDKGLSQQTQKSPRSMAGFTLLEMMLVLAILALASVLVVPNLTGLEARTYSAQIRQASSLLNYARRIAVVSGQPATASFFVKADDSRSDGAGKIANNVEAVGRWDSSGAALKFTDSTDREIEVEEKIDITFFPEGGSTGGTLEFSQQQQLTRIIIDPFTGRITTEKDPE